MRFALLTRSALVLLACAAAACTDEHAPTTTPPPEPGPKAPNVLGVYDITITGIGSDQVRATVTPVRPEGGASATLTPVTSGLVLEQAFTGVFTEGPRPTASAPNSSQLYLSSTFRVRNATAGPLTNVTFIMASTAASISGTPISVLRKYDNSAAPTSLATKVAPTGFVALSSDLTTLVSPYPDVLQVFSEPEIAAIAPPAGVTNIFPYGFVVRNKNTTANRILPSAAADANQYDGVMTVAYRIPLQDTKANDVFTLTFQAVAVEDTQTRLTESIEESQDSGAVRRLRDRATSLGATMVTVLDGSPVVDPAVSDYPGQRQICGTRIAGIPANTLNTIVTPGAYSGVMMLMPGESVDPGRCAPYFRVGTAGRPATNVAFNVNLRPADRYGNVLMGPAYADTMRLIETNGVPNVAGPAAPVDTTTGLATANITYSDYGSGILKVQGRRMTGQRPVPVAGVKRTWTAGAGSFNWQVNGNWSPAAVPMQLDTAIVPAAAPLYPILSANVQIGGVQVENNAFIRLEAFDMTASSDVTAGATGGIQNTSGRLFLAGIAHTVEGKMPPLRVTGTYSATVGTNSNITARAPVTVDAGRLTVSGLRLQVDSN